MVRGQMVRSMILDQTGAVEVARSNPRWYAVGWSQRFGLVELNPPRDEPEPRNAREDGLRGLHEWTINFPSPVISNVRRKRVL
jgi:hypothetical protein